jgi:serine/threonine protein kinase
MDPRIFAQQAFEGRSCDIFSAGVCLFLMVTGSPPWSRPEMSDQRFKMIYSNRLQQLLTHWGMQRSAPLVDLMQRMLCPPAQRLTADQVLAHPWLKRP